MARQQGIQALVRDKNILVLYVERDTARHFQNAVGTANGPFGRDVAVIVDAPDTHVRFVGGEFGERTVAADAHHDLALRGIDGKRAAESIETAPRSAEHRLGLPVAAVRSFEDQQPSLTSSRA